MVADRFLIFATIVPGVTPVVQMIGLQEGATRLKKIIFTGNYLLTRD